MNHRYKPFKAPGADGVLPVFLQEGIIKVLIGYLVKVLRTSIALAYVARAWKLTRIFFISKAGKPSHTSVKNFRPNSLNSFIFKTLERLVDIYIYTYVQDVVLTIRSLHPNQHAYSTGHLTEIALHSAVYRIEEQLQKGEIMVGAFLDMAEAFNRTSTETIREAARKQGVSESLVNWLWSIQSNRMVEAHLGSTKVTVTVSKGCAQSAVSFPTIWCQVANDLFEALNVGGCYLQAYTDDFLILIQRKGTEAAMDVMREGGTMERINETLCQSRED